MSILAINAGSSSLKFSLHPLVDGQAQPEILAGSVQGLEPGGSPQIGWKYQGLSVQQPLDIAPGRSAFDEALERLRGLAPLLQQFAPLQAVAHRVVHGGGEFIRSVVVDDAVLERLTQFNSLAPLHQPHNVEGIRRIRAAFPDLPVFWLDTSSGDEQVLLITEETLRQWSEGHTAGLKL